MNFTTKDKAAIWALVRDVKFVESEDFKPEQTARRMHALTIYLEIDEEIERVSKKMELDDYIAHISDFSTAKKEIVVAIILWVLDADGKITKGEGETLNHYMVLCELPTPTASKLQEVAKAIVEADNNPNKTINEKSTQNSSKHEWQYYAKKFTEDYEEDSWKYKWEKIIPLTPQEAIGAMVFAKTYLEKEKDASKTLERIIEICEEEFNSNEEIQKVLPKYKKVLSDYQIEKQKKNAEAQKRHAKLKLYKQILWCIVTVLLILQIVYWGWWTILSGIVTLSIALAINFTALND